MQARTGHLPYASLNLVSFKRAALEHSGMPKALLKITFQISNLGRFFIWRRSLRLPQVQCTSQEDGQGFVKRPN